MRFYLTDESGNPAQNVDKLSNGIAQSNVGHKLLKMMGWTGGGLGKGGQGISEPIRAADFNNRQGIKYFVIYIYIYIYIYDLARDCPNMKWNSFIGFGSSQTDIQFKSKIRKLLEEYTSSHNPYDLIFTPDFSSEQRATIHK